MWQFVKPASSVSFLTAFMRVTGVTFRYLFLCGTSLARPWLAASLNQTLPFSDNCSFWIQSLMAEYGEFRYSDIKSQLMLDEAGLEVETRPTQILEHRNKE